MSFATAIKAARQACGLSQQAVADKLGVKQATYFVYERKENPPVPSIEIAAKLAKICNVSLDYLAGLTDDPTPHWNKAAAEEKPAQEGLTLEKLQAQIDELKAIVSNQTFNERLNLSQNELKIFAQEIADMVKEGKPVDVGRAIRNAQYLAEIDRRAANVEAGKNVVSFTAEEWEKFNEGSV